jgi:hypothetical protein
VSLGAPSFSFKMQSFDAFAVIDWSGANSRWHRGIALAVCQAGDEAPTLIAPKDAHWTRSSIFEWLITQADLGRNILIGLDLSIALPFLDRGAYFPDWVETPTDAKQLWALVDTLSSADEHLSVASFIEHPEIARHFRQVGRCGDLFEGGAGRFRLCESIGQATIDGINPYSCFNLVGAAQVGKSSLTGMRVLHRLGGAIPVWPFDPIPETGPCIIEIYTSIAARAADVLPKGRSKITDADLLDRALATFESEPHGPLGQKYTDHATDAILTAAWLRFNATRADYWRPKMLSPEIASTEGWTFGTI